MNQLSYMQRDTNHSHARRLGALFLGAIVAIAVQAIPVMDAHASGYYKLGGIDVDVKDNHQDGWVEINSMSTPSLDVNGTTCPAAKSGPGEIVISTLLDASSGELQASACSGETISRVGIHMHSGKKASAPYVRYELSNVTISGYKIGTTTNRKGEMVPTEEVTLDYTEVEWTYVTPDR